nr:O-antigen ligase family protein [Candidatus Dependentiae bacterium]
IICIRLLSTLRGVLISQVDRPLYALVYIFYFLYIFFILFFSYKSIKSKNNISHFIKFLVFFSAAYCCYSLSSIFISGNRFLHTLYIFDNQYIPAENAVFFIPLFFFFYGIMFQEKKISAKIWYVFLLCLVEGCIIFSYSRSGYIIFGCLLIFFSLLQRKFINIILSLLFIIILINVISNNTGIKNYIEKTFHGKTEFIIPSLSDSEKTIKLDDSTAAKISKYENILSYWKEYPIFGLGVTGAGFVESQFFLILGETGIMGILGYSLFFGYFFKMTSRLKKKCADTEFYGIISGYRYCLISIIALGFLINVFYFNVISIIFGVLSGIIFRIKFIAEANKI